MSIKIYKASAGSGKTFTLSATYIANLLTKEMDYPHKHQLAVTFTNKATAEMKERILQYLYSLSHGMPETDNFFQEIRSQVPPAITNNMIRSLARQALHNIIHDYDHFHVTTIDSFFQSLLANLAHELGLSASFKVEISDKEVLSKAVDRLLQNIPDNSKELEWVTDYVRDKMDENKSWNVAHELKDLAEQLTKEKFLLHKHLLEQKNEQSEELINNKFLRDYKNLLLKTERTARASLADKAAAAIRGIEDTLTFDMMSRSGDIVKWLNKAADKDINLGEMKTPSATFCGYADGSKCMLKKADQGKADNEQNAEIAKQYLADVVQCYNAIVSTCNSCRLSRANLNPLRLLGYINAEVENLNKENDRMLLAYTPMLFHNLTGDNDASFVFERAGTQYKHIMIDEFQDTSPLQWDNMHHLLLENASCGYSCMLVGDVKQGIYRFRGGDWNALAGFKDGYNQQLNAEVKIETLKTNFRSGRNIVEFNNHVFTTAPQYIEDKLKEDYTDETYKNLEEKRTIQYIYPTPDPDHDIHEVTQLVKNEGGFVRVELYNIKKAEKEKSEEGETAPKDDFDLSEAVASQMIRLHKAGVPFNEMAILIRSKSDAKDLMTYFEEHHGATSDIHIPLISEEAFLLDSSSAVKTIIQALRYANNPNDLIAREYISKNCPKGKEDEIIATLNDWHSNRYSGLPFYEATCRLASLFELDRMPGQSPYTYCLLDAILAYIDDNTSDINAFLQYWDETLHSKSIPSAAIDGVRILTIHKSKGLAFHSVFIPCCNWKIESHPELAWVTPESAPYNALPLLPISLTKAAADSIYRETYLQDKFDKYAENLNLMYVAFTRARQNLLIWADCKHESIAKVLQSTLPEATEIYELGQPSSLEIKHNADQDKTSEGQDKSKEASTSDNPLDYNSQRIDIEFTNHHPRLQFMQSHNARLMLSRNENEGIEESNPQSAEEVQIQEDYRKTGILLHQLMSSIESASDVQPQILTFARAGMLPASLSPESLQRLITSRLRHPIVQKWFDGSWRLYRECSILSQEEGKIVVRRPDRVMTRGNRAEGTDETIVVDFKFGRFQPEHRQQVATYMNLLERQGLHCVKGYLWYLYSGSIEEVEKEAEKRD